MNLLCPAPALAIVALSVLAGCSDPADKVHKSSASDPAAAASSADASSGGSAAGTTAAAKTYVVRSESALNFVGSKVTGSHNGGFKNVAGSLTVENGKITGAPAIQIGMKSIWSDNDRLTGHLKSGDFFDVEKFPVSTFKVTAIGGTDPATNTITGDLTLHGVTKTISFPAAIQIADDALIVKAAFAINRKQWNINYPGRPNDLIRDNVVIKLDLKATAGPARPEDQLVN